MGDVAQQIRGVTYSKADASAEPRSGFLPVLRAGNIQNGLLTFDDLVFIPSERVGQKQRVRKNDVVIAASSGSLDVVGKAARSLDDYEGGFGAFLKVLRPCEEVDPSYFAHYFQTASYRRTVSALASGANINNLKNEHLDELAIPLPPIDEQRRIAAILDQADSLRKQCEQACASLDELNRSAYFHTFGNPLHGSGNRQRLGDVGEVITGNTPSRSDPDNYGEEIEWIKSDNLGATYATEAEERLSPTGKERSRIAPAGSVLVTCIAGSPASIGKCSLVDREVAFNQQINAAVPGPGIDGRFLLEQLKVAPELVRGQSTGGMKGLVSKTSFMSIEIQVPPLEHQRNFVKLTKEIDELRGGRAAVSAELDNLFASLQSRAFSGKL